MKFINGIQGTNPHGRQWNQILDAVVTIIKYKKSTTNNEMYIPSYLTVSTDDMLNTTK